MSPAAWLLLASLAVNAGLGWAWVGAREDLAAGRVLLDNSQAAASACSDATDDLRELADKRGKEAAAARRLAAGTAAARARRADEILSKPPAVPGNDCASARAQVDDWLGGRK